MRLTRFDFLFWAAGLLLNLGLLGTLWYRRRYRTFPVFTAMIALVVCKTCVLFLVRRYERPLDYFYAYWLLALFDTMLQLGVVYEIARQVFRPVQGWAPGLRRTVSALAALSVLTAAGVSWMASPPVSTQVQETALRANLFATGLMSELFVAMVVVSFLARLPWRSHAAAIAQGLGGYSLVSMLMEAGHICFGIGRDTAASVVLSQVRMLAYLGCALFWVVNLNSQEETGRSMTQEMRAALFTLQDQLTGDLRAVRFWKGK